MHDVCQIRLLKCNSLNFHDGETLQPQQKGYFVALFDVIEHINVDQSIMRNFLFHFHNWKLKLKLQVKPNNFTDTKLINE